MKSSSANRRTRQPRRDPRQPVVRRLIENDVVRKLSFDEYRRRVRKVYDGPQGAALSTLSALSLHMPLGERLIKLFLSDAGPQRILDVGSGAGQLAGHVLKFAHPGSDITCFDLSWSMMRRARARLKSDVPRLLVADLAALPFKAESFDRISCGYVLEHLPDPRPGLAELARVLVPGGRILLLTSEDTFGGAWTSRLWLCRTYNRRELRQTCGELGLAWKRELWMSRIHKLLGAGGICAELEKAS